MAEKGDWPSAMLSVHAFLQREQASIRRPFHHGDQDENQLKDIGRNLAHTSIGEELKLEICMASCMLMVVIVAIVLVVVVLPTKLN
jgi:hypothetical protein